MAEEVSKPHVLLVPSPGMGHLIPLMELASTLVTHHDFHATIVVVSSSSPEQPQLIHSAKSQNLYDIIELPAPSSGLDSSAAGSSPITHLYSIMHEVRPSLRSAVSAMNSKPAAIIVDMFGTPTYPVAEEFHMLKYVRTSSAWAHSFLLYAPVLDEQIQGEYPDHEEELIKIPGCMPARRDEMGRVFMNKKEKDYESFLRLAKEIALMSDGILLNTWEDLEATTLKAMREHPEWKKVLKAQVYTIGPVVRLGGQSFQSNHSPTTLRSELLDWLDEQPSESVLYISFGSVGTLSAEQITEMAWGLELSKQRFIWVVHPPKGGDKGNDISAYLPEGFMARTQDKGVVVTGWAPQSEILAHSSVGGFITHCGWNSTLESIMNNAFPMIAWPLYAEQPLIATQLVGEFKIAVRPKVLPTKAVVGREEVEMLVRTVMEQGKRDAMKARAKELKASGEKAASVGGSSFNTLSELSRLCKINTKQQCQDVAA